MLVKLTAAQCRVIGVMMEKEVTTPDQYPLSLNGLTNGCNQKSNREPVMSLSEAEVQDVLHELKDKKQILEQSGFGSRVCKYKHKFCNTEFGDLKLSRQQFAIICVLLLRGPQTPGELRTRTNRLADFSNVEEVESVLNDLMDLNGEQLVVRLAREPGKRESRYAHCFAEQPISDTEISSNEGRDDAVFLSAPAPASAGQHDPNTRITALEAQVEALTAQVEKLQQTLDELL